MSFTCSRTQNSRGFEKSKLGPTEYHIPLPDNHQWRSPGLKDLQNITSSIHPTARQPSMEKPKTRGPTSFKHPTARQPSMEKPKTQGPTTFKHPTARQPSMEKPKTQGQNKSPGPSEYRVRCYQRRLETLNRGAVDEIKPTRSTF